MSYKETMPTARPAGKMGEPTTASLYFAINQLIADIPEPKELVDTIVVFPGAILNAAMAAAARNIEYSDFPALKHLVVAGYHVEEVGHEQFDTDSLKRIEFDFSEPEVTIDTQIVAHHPGDQARWCVEMLKMRGSKVVALFVPGFHMTRAYLLMIEAMRREGYVVPVFPVWPCVNPFTQLVLDPATNEHSLSVLDVIHDEARHMEEGSTPKADGNQGDVATYERFVEYLRSIIYFPGKNSPVQAAVSEYVYDEHSTDWM